MRIFFQKTVSHSKDSEGKKKTQFQVIKGKNDMVHQVSGISLNNNPDMFQVAESIRVLNKNRGKILSKEREFKMKSANILSLLKDGYMSEKANKNTNKNTHKDTHKDTIKKVTFTPKSKKTVPIKKVKKVDVKEKKPVKKITKTEVKEKKPVKKITKTEVKKKNPVKKMVKVVKNNK
jgi:hypothetical protein